MQLVGDEMGGGLLPRPRKVDPGSFTEATKLVTIDIGQRSSRKKLNDGIVNERGLVGDQQLSTT